jgi:hypothetical protein
LRAFLYHMEFSVSRGGRRYRSLSLAQ